MLHSQGTVPTRDVELDLLVIGSGPGGQKAAIQAAKLGKRVAVAERRDRLGGVSIHTGTIPSKTLRQAVLEQLAKRPLDVLDPTRVEETERAGARSSCWTARRAWSPPRPRSCASSSGATTSGCCPATRASRTTTRSASRAPTSRSAPTGS